MALNLQFTPEQQRFRAEVRAWMDAHVPKVPLKTLESEAGFAQHRQWERTLALGAMAVALGLLVQLFSENLLTQTFVYWYTAVAITFGLPIALQGTGTRARREDMALSVSR